MNNKVPVLSCEAWGSAPPPVTLQDSRQIYEALRKSEERYRELVEHANSIIMRWDKNGIITFFNEYAQQFFGYSEEEIIGKHVVGTIVPANESTGRDLCPLMEQICNHPEEHHYNVNENITKNGRRVWVAWTNKLLTDDQGNAIGVLSIGTDITKQRLLEEELRQAHKMQAIGELAGGIAHDFNNMIHGIIGYAEAIQQLTDDPRLGEYSTHILTTAHHAAELTKQLLTFARKGSYQLTECNTHEIIRDVCAILERTIDRRIRVSQQLDASRPHVMGDPAQLKSALLNLGINAKDAMPNGGSLRFSTRNISIDSPTKIYDFEIEAGEYLLITICDSGTGMSAEIRRRIFEPFFTTKESGRGAGLGLAAVYGTTHLHKGAIRCRSSEGQGSSFDLYLPIIRDCAKHLRQSPKPSGKERKIRIMVVDDEAIVRNYSKTLFEMHGHQVRTFAGAEEAINFYRRSYMNVDLVLLDMIMPRMDGQQLFKILKGINPEIKAILSTGYSVDSKVQETLTDGILDYIQKPFTYEQLQEKIDAMASAGHL
ncbi:hybrid sensor histidine kinase/response regulator [Microbulbifer thermotolerans]|uniref:hybrid sensor histidine kinase/response regulator n=1 Tax=Microbulbifer thermotolerans TaxID=252514 RepID=UPI00224A6E7C|nr:PAS domain S-box protein [Microbulbifer thermotolerans]MCX2834421.1 PAS domain S-box protein [Microbulbifer thermotolerans]